MTDLQPQHVRPQTLERLADTFDFSLSGDPSVEISGIASASSAVRDGDLFIALPGSSAHGAQFAADACAAGARAVLTNEAGAELCQALSVPVLQCADPRAALAEVSAWLYRTGERSEDDDQLIFGVTGTNGKTSVVYLLAAIAEHVGRPVVLSSTAERRIGADVQVSALTTPESNELHALLACGRERDVHTAVLEVSAHALSRHRVDGVLFDVAGFTNLSQDHLDDYPSMQAYYEAKRELFTPERARRGVICVDDEWGEKLVEESRIPVTTLSTNPDSGADWIVRVESETLEQTEFTLTGRRLELRLAVPLLGAFSAVNAALALIMWDQAGWDIEASIGAIPAARIDVFIPGRAEVVSGDTGPRVLIDYAHTPGAYDALLAGVRRVCSGRIIMVFGADGNRDTTKRAAMGASAAAGADLLIVTDYHPRWEDPAQIRAALIDGARAARADVVIEEIADPRSALRRALATAEPDDVVLVVGPGHEDYHEVAGVKMPYSARETARALLHEMGWTHD